jgi:FkbM family methyltransferase
MSYFFHMFPFDKVKEKSRIIIYGGGVMGHEYYQQIKAINYCEVLCVADRNYEKLIFAGGMVKVIAPEKIAELNPDYVVIATEPLRQRQNYHSEILDKLLSLNVTNDKIVCQTDGIFLPGEEKLARRISNAQYGEDIMTFFMFDALRIEKPSYIDVGAHHPYELSNTWMFYFCGSRGINIEANPDLIFDFNRERPEDINICAGIGATEGILPFYMYTTSALNTFSERVVERLGRRGFCPLKKIDLPVVTLQSVVDKYAGGKWPDYMSIDIEGLEYDVLASVDLKDGPIAITAEIDKVDLRLMKDMMASKGYTPYHRTRGNITYVKNRHIDDFFLNIPG